MRTIALAGTLLAAATLTVSCSDVKLTAPVDRGSHPSFNFTNGPSSPGQATLAAPNALADAIHAAATVRLVTVKDACDATTFNAAVGPGTCVRREGVRFSDFVAELTRQGEVGAWHFAPPMTTAQLHDTFLAVDRGGEVHTFTHVAAFGGGIIDFLNQLSHNPVPAPECLTLKPDDFIAPGATYTEKLDQSGAQRFQCCIHPWMRLTAQVSND